MTGEQERQYVETLLHMIEQSVREHYKAIGEAPLSHSDYLRVFNARFERATALVQSGSRGVEAVRA